MYRPRRALLALFLQGDLFDRGPRTSQRSLAAWLSETYYPCSQATVSRDLAWLRARRRLTAERPGGHPVDLLSKWAREQIRKWARPPRPHAGGAGRKPEKTLHFSSDSGPRG